MPRCRFGRDSLSPRGDWGDEVPLERAAWRLAGRLSLAVLAVLGHRIPAQVRTFLLAFATADDIGGASMLAGIGGYLFLRLTGERVSTRPD